MKTLDKGQEKIKKICDVLRRETLEPAKHEAEAIRKEARQRAEAIILEAEKQAKKIIDEARQAIEQERNVFHSSLAQASKQSLEALRQSIEQKLFNDELERNLAKHTSDPRVIAKIVDAIVQGIEKEGISKDFSAVIPQSVSPEEVSRYIGAEVLKKLKEGPIAVGAFGGGTQIKLADKKMTIDMTDKTLADYLKSYVRKDFRKLIFSKNSG